MNKEELQKLWDQTLIEGWQGEWKLGGVKAHTYRRANGIGQDVKLDWAEIDKFFDDSDLKRYEQYGGQVRVRAFIESRSSNLSGCLWSGKYSDDEILAAIDRFKWKDNKVMRQAYHNRKNSKKQHAKKKHQSTEFVRARSLGKKHDWKTVK